MDPFTKMSLFGRPKRTYLQQLSVDTRYSLQDLPGAMDNKNGSRELVEDIRAFRKIQC